MTVILTIVGVIVFVASCFTVGFKPAFKRMAGFAITGLIIDVLLGFLGALFIYGYGF